VLQYARGIQLITGRRQVETNHVAKESVESSQQVIVQ
jgi:hypothetical protein